tara:strand:- start:86 stop:196 length:111 start_codon:yes stop_codon:yes gene_type:complete
LLSAAVAQLVCAGLIALDEFMLAMATSVELKMAGDM